MEHKQPTFNSLGKGSGVNFTLVLKFDLFLAKVFKQFNFCSEKSCWFTFLASEKMYNWPSPGKSHVDALDLPVYHTGCVT